MAHLVKPLFNLTILKCGYLPIKSRRTKRALDGWDSAAFTCFFLHPGGILLPSRIHARPSAGNANRWAPLSKTIQSSAQIGDVIYNAVVFNVKNWLGGTMNSDSLIQSVQDFFAVLEKRKIDYVLVGGIAILHYVEGRNTQDLDLLMAVVCQELCKISD